MTTCYHCGSTVDPEIGGRCPNCGATRRLKKRRIHSVASDASVRQLSDEIDREAKQALSGCAPILLAVLSACAALGGALLVFLVVLVAPTAPHDKVSELVEAFVLGSGMGVGGLFVLVVMLVVMLGSNKKTK